MTSGKQSRRQRQAARVGAPPAGGARRASPQVLVGAAVLLVVAGVAVGLSLALGGGSSSGADVPARGSLVNALPGARDVRDLLAGIPQDGNVLGRPSAPVTLVEYVDLQCPFCRELEMQVIPPLVSRYVSTGKLKIETRPLAFVGSDSQRGRDAAIAAGYQDRMFDLMAILFANQGGENTGWLDDDMVTAAGASIPGLAVPRLLEERESSRVANAAAALDLLAQEGGIDSTPTILVGKSGETLREVTLSSATDTQAVAAAIEQALR